MDLTKLAELPWYYYSVVVQTIVIHAIRKSPNWPFLRTLKALWYKVPDGWRWVVPFLLACSQAFVDAYNKGLPFEDAVRSVIAIAFGSMGLNALLTELPGGWNGGAGGPDKPLPKPKKEVLEVSGVASVVLFLLCVFGCSSNAARDVVWPTVARCAPPPAAIKQDVISELQQDPGAELTDKAKGVLKSLAKKHGPEVVACVVHDFVDQLATPENPTDAKAKAKGQQFLDQIGTKFEE
jgi:hypothetical protein